MSFSFEKIFSQHLFKNTYIKKISCFFENKITTSSKIDLSLVMKPSILFKRFRINYLVMLAFEIVPIS